MKPKVGIISCDYDGTLAGYYELNHEDQIKKFQEDMQIFKNEIFLIKTLEKLDYVYFSLNTREDRIEVLTTVLSAIFGQEDWLHPGPQFLADGIYFFDLESQNLSGPIQEEYDERYIKGDKLNNLSVFALKHIEKEDIVSVTHIEDGKNYSFDELELLKDVGIETHIINLPHQSTRNHMLETFQDNVSGRVDKK